MNVENNKQPSGSLKISQDVLATISNFAAEEIDGVVSLADTYAPIKNFLKKGSIGKPIQISLNDDVAVIDISVNLKYGANIPAVAETLQKAVTVSYTHLDVYKRQARNRLRLWWSARNMRRSTR